MAPGSRSVAWTRRGMLSQAAEIAAGRSGPAARESMLVDVAAGLVGLLAGLAAGPLADRAASNAPERKPLLARTPVSARLALVMAATGLLGGASGLAFGLTLEALIAGLFCWVLVVVTRTDLEHRIIPNRIVVPGTVVLLGLRTVEDPSVV